MWAVQDLFTVVNDAIGYGENAPDPNMIVIQGIQNLSAQISAFEQYTQTAFESINAQLGAISTSIAMQTYAITAQLQNAQSQITALGGTLQTLEGSVDQLQSEVQSLFAANANNDLAKTIQGSVGYAQANGVPLPQASFAGAADTLFSDATTTALSPTVLAPAGPSDALSADLALTASSADPLGSDIDYLDVFPGRATDGPTGQAILPGPLAAGCASGGQPGGLCLPEPDFWAAAARGFAQLLLENPADVTATRLAQLQQTVQEGDVLQSATSRISANDVAGDSTGTGSRLFDGLLAYYRYWASGTHPSGTAPSLQQALHDEQETYLATQLVPSEGLSDTGVDPWAGPASGPTTQACSPRPPSATSRRATRATCRRTARPCRACRPPPWGSSRTTFSPPSASAWPTSASARARSSPAATRLAGRPGPTACSSTSS